MNTDASSIERSRNNSADASVHDRLAQAQNVKGGYMQRKTSIGQASTAASTQHDPAVEAVTLRHELELLNSLRAARGAEDCPQFDTIIATKTEELKAIMKTNEGSPDLQLEAAVGTDSQVPPEEFTHEELGSEEVFPGPKNKEVLVRCAESGVDAFGSVHTVFNLQQSYGMYAVDADGVARIDMLGHIASNALGYNHPLMIEKHLQADTITAATARVASGIIVTEDYIETVEKLRDINQDLTSDDRRFYFQFQADGTSANENAAKAALMCRKEWDEKEDVVVEGQLIMASFENAFHGRSSWMLSLLHSPNRAHFSKGVPLIESAKLSYPPLNATEEDEDQCVATNRFVIESYHGRIGGVILEPVQAEGGDKHCSGRFLAMMQEVFDQHRIILIIDEVQSGMGVSGTLWAYESLKYEGEIALQPDFITWSKKAQIGGYHYTDRIRETLQNQPYRIFNTWLGDPRKVKDMCLTLEYIRDNNILDTSKELGEQLMSIIDSASQTYPEITNIRGLGTLVAFDLPSSQDRNEFLNVVKQNGAVMAGCGLQSIRLRPPLICREKHVLQWEQIFLKTLGQVFQRCM